MAVGCRRGVKEESVEARASLDFVALAQGVMETDVFLVD